MRNDNVKIEEERERERKEKTMCAKYEMNEIIIALARERSKWSRARAAAFV